MISKIVIKKSAQKELDSLPKGDQVRIVEAIRSLVSEEGDIKAIKNMIDTFRLRVGRYRVIFHADSERSLITIWRIAHRKVAYRNL